MNECLTKPLVQNKNVSTILEFLIQVNLYHKAVSICGFYFMFLYQKNQKSILFKYKGGFF